MVVPETEVQPEVVVVVVVAVWQRYVVAVRSCAAVVQKKEVATLAATLVCSTCSTYAM